MAHTLAVGRTELRNTVDASFAQCGCQRALDILFGKRLDTRNVDAVGSE